MKKYPAPVVALPPPRAPHVPEPARPVVVAPPAPPPQIVTVEAPGITEAADAMKTFVSKLGGPIHVKIIRDQKGRMSDLEITR
jgi:hypothetical protein